MRGLFAVAIVRALECDNLWSAGTIAVLPRVRG